MSIESSDTKVEQMELKLLVRVAGALAVLLHSVVTRYVLCVLAPLCQAAVQHVPCKAQMSGLELCFIAKVVPHNGPPPHLVA